MFKANKAVKGSYFHIFNFISESRDAVNSKELMQFNANVKYGMLEIALMKLPLKRILITRTDII